LNTLIKKIIPLLLTALALLSGCNITHNVAEGEYLLDKTSIALDKSNTGLKELNFDTDNLYGIIRQKKMTQYLDNYGFFNSRVTPEVTKKDKKARVKYNVELARPYTIKNIYYKIQDPVLRDFVINNENNFSIKKHNIYNANLLDDDRYIITKQLRDIGYFYFSPGYIYFEVDSAFNNHELDIYLNIKQVQIISDTNPAEIIKKDHQRFFIDQVSINPNFDPLRTDTSKMLTFRNPDTTNGIDRFLFYYRDKLKIRPKAIRNSIFLEPLKLYSEISEKNTYKQLSSLPLYGYTSMEFRQVEDNPILPDTSKKYLNCAINLTRRPVQSFSVETEGTTSDGQLGAAGNFVYQNLNIFRGGEVLTIKFTGGVEWQQGGQAENNVFLFFNTFETGAEASVDFPKFLLPISQDRMPKLLRPRTTIKTGFNYQNRPDYERYVTNLSFGYNWRGKKFVSHSLIPSDLNSVSIFPDSAFIKKIDELNDPRLKNQYTDHFIMAVKYSYIFNDQQRDRVKNFMFLRWDIETAGNLIGLINNVSNAPENENGEHTIFTIPYAQYVRATVDFRYYFALDDESTFVYRNLFGIGVPFGNSSALPFEKGFYAGGASDMRGWRYRTLGPGSFRDTSGSYFERMGDIILQANLEYRFPVYSFLKGAIFADFGNIWLLNSSTTFPGGKFKFDDFLGEIAINGGLGARLDFNFFIFRIDAAAPLKNPAFPTGERWRINNLKLKDVIWNFGIGYPF